MIKINERQLQKIRRNQLQIHLHLGYTDSSTIEVKRKIKLSEQRQHLQPPATLTQFKAEDWVQITKNYQRNTGYSDESLKVSKHSSQLSFKSYPKGIFL